MFKIRRECSKPAWVQIREEIRQRICEGFLPPGAILPSSIEMAIRLLCHPESVEKAYRVLLAQGWILSMSSGIPVVAAIRSVDGEVQAGGLGSSVHKGWIVGFSGDESILFIEGGDEE